MFSHWIDGRSWEAIPIIYPKTHTILSPRSLNYRMTAWYISVIGSDSPRASHHAHLTIITVTPQAQNQWGQCGYLLAVGDWEHKSSHPGRHYSSPSEWCYSAATIKVFSLSPDGFRVMGNTVRPVNYMSMSSWPHLSSYKMSSLVAAMLWGI